MTWILLSTHGMNIFLFHNNKTLGKSFYIYFNKRVQHLTLPINDDKLNFYSAEIDKSISVSLTCTHAKRERERRERERERESRRGGVKYIFFLQLLPAMSFFMRFSFSTTITATFSARHCLNR